MIQLTIHFLSCTNVCTSYCEGFNITWKVDKPRKGNKQQYCRPSIKYCINFCGKPGYGNRPVCLDKPGYGNKPG